MIQIKSSEEVKIMQKGGKILSEVLRTLLDNVKCGVRLSHLDKLAERQIVKRGARPSFKMVKGYNWSICSCVNEVVVHGVPNDYLLVENDVVGIDCGVYYQGFHTDAAWTVRVKDKGEANRNKTDQFLYKGQEVLKHAIAEVKVGNYIYDISSKIQKEIEESGYSVVRTLVGHGVGRNLHEEPEVPCLVREKRDNTPKITEGMVLAIEIIYNMGTPDVMYKGMDGWTIMTKDGKISGLFEATVAATIHGCIVLTPLNGLAKLGLNC